MHIHVSLFKIHIQTGHLYPLLNFINGYHLVYFLHQPPLQTLLLLSYVIQN